MRRWAILVALAVVATALPSCGGGGDGGGVGREGGLRFVAEGPGARRTPPADAATVRLLGESGPLVVIADEPSLDVHARPGTVRPYMDLETTNPWGQSLRLLVVGRGLDDEGRIWLRIQLPVWPNGQTGWVAASEVSLERAAERVVVDLSRRRLTRFRDQDPVTRVPVAVGTATTPTPPGRYFVWARVTTGRPSGPYGSFILGLSGFSEAIHPSDWPGEPRLAIHGTDDPSDVGRAVSNGCVRVLNALLRHLRDVPMGTPVLIKP